MRVRITVIATAAVAVGLSIGGAALLGGLRSALVDSHAGTGPHRAAELAALAAKGPLANPLAPVDGGGTTLLQVIGPTGSVDAASAELRDLPPLVDPASRHREVLHAIVGLGEQRWLAESTPATLGGRRSVVIVYTSLRDEERSAELLRNSLLAGIPVLIGVVGVVVWLVVGRALRPVEAMRTEVERINVEHLDRRVPTPAAHDEIARLATTLNDMLDRLQAATDAQRRFVADASHELRSPIANIRASLEVATAHPGRADWTAVADDVLAQDARMERLTDDLLLLARSGAAEVALRRVNVDVAALVREQLLRHVPADRRIEAAAVAMSAVVNGDRDQLARALTNLVDNALRHARRRVTLGVAVGARSVEVRVSDDGPGIAPGDRDAAFLPFVRLDGHRARSSGGTGLGLAIVRQIVDAHGGSIAIADGSPGAVLIVRLPLSGSSQSDGRSVKP